MSGYLILFFHIEILV